MSKFQTRNRMADKKHKNHLNFVANTQLLDSSEQADISPMSTMAVNNTTAFHILSESLDIINKQLQFLLMIIDTTNSETFTINC